MIEKNFVGWANIPNELYHKTAAIGSSSLKKILESPLEYQYYLSAPKEPKAHFDLGQCLHDVNLEQTTERFVVGPDVNKNTNIWKDFKKANEGKVVLDVTQYENVMNGFEMFCRHRIAHKLVSHCQKIEQSGFYKCEVTGLWLKFRPDGDCLNDTEGDYIFDYKSAKAIDKDSIEKAIMNLGYHVSAAHYIAGHKALTGRDIKDYYLCFQKSSGSMDVVVKRLNDESIAHGMEIRNTALLKIADCLDKDYWPGVSDQVESTGIPDWGYRKSVQFLTEEAV